MKKSLGVERVKKCGLLFLIAGSLSACRPAPQKLPSAESNAVKDSVQNMIQNISRDVSGKGPAAWLNYFEDSPDFFMAADGKIAFPGYRAAKKIVLDTLVKTIPRITLKWANLKIEPLSKELAAVGAYFHEELTDSNGKMQRANGYFTAIAAFNGQRWRLKNLHWSILH